ncbi:MAG: nucleotidyltransferase domain-containing protein [Solirubrobacterales bacterium]|nr:nucleotidyltransferase domain-containing protein [Solirubrobacterales bacterium]
MIAQDLELPIDLDALRSILRMHGVVKASVFGSYARGESRAGSDLDLVVDYGPEVTLFDHFDLKGELEQRTLGPVDVVSGRAVSSHRRPHIERDAVEIL